MALIIGVSALGSTTFAKYITSETFSSQKENVAQWGFIVEVDASDLFHDAYNRSTNISKSDATIDVKADSKNKNVVAPGKSGSMSFKIGGKAEVYSKLTIITSTNPDVFLEDLNDAGDSRFYYPVKWTLKKNNVPLLENTTLETITTTLRGYSQNIIQPGQPLTHAGIYTIEWKWDFGTDETNKKDTLLAQISNGAEVEGYNAKTNLEFRLQIRLEQIRAPEPPID